MRPENGPNNDRDTALITSNSRIRRGGITDKECPSGYIFVRPDTKGTYIVATHKALTANRVRNGLL